MQEGRHSLTAGDPFFFGGAMNISQLEYLVSAIHLGSYSRAAKEQFVTPQAFGVGTGLEADCVIGENYIADRRGVVNCRRGRSGYPPCRQNRLNRFLV